VFLNDQVFSGPESSAAITFLDETVLSLGADSALTVDELVYDPDGQDSVANFSLIGGALGFVSGDIAKTGDMTVTTPVSTIGIRGTAGFVTLAVGVFRNANGTFQITAFQVDGSGQPQVVTLTVDPSGFTGSLVVTQFGSGGGTTTLTQTNQTVTTTSNGTTTVSTLTPEQVSQTYGNAVSAIQSAIGSNFATGDSVTSQDQSLIDAVEELLELLEENPAQDASDD